MARRNATQSSREARARRRLDPAAQGEPVDVDHDGDGEDNRRDEACREQRGHREPGDRPDDDHQDARRHQDAHGGGRGDDRHRELLAIARADHGRDGGRGHRRHVGHRRAGDPGEDVLRRHHGHAEAAAHPAHERHREVDEPPRDAAALHERSREDEERKGEKDERVDLVEHLLHGDGDRRGRGEDGPAKPAAPTATATGAPTTRSPRKSRLTSVKAGRPSLSWGSANRIISAPPTGSAPKNQSWEISRASVTCRCAIGAMRMPPATRMAPKAMTVSVTSRPAWRRAAGPRRSTRRCMRKCRRRRTATAAPRKMIHTKQSRATSSYHRNVACMM